VNAINHLTAQIYTHTHGLLYCALIKLIGWLLACTSQNELLNVFYNFIIWKKLILWFQMTTTHNHCTSTSTVPI